MKTGKTWLWPALGVIVAWSLGGCWAPENAAVKNEENVPPETGSVFRTGTWRSNPRGASNFAVSPDGTRIIFNTGQTVEDGLLMLDLKSGQKIQLPGERNRAWGMGNWSHDGQQIVAVSTAVRDNRYQIGEQKIILIDPKNWRYRKLATTPGVNINPFFSADGKSVYYFKGKKRKSGKTPAADYDLHVYDLALDREMRLTHEKMYMVSGGYDDGNEIFFTAYNIKRIPSINPLNGNKQDGIYALNKTTLELRLVNVDQSSGFFNLYFGGKDGAGNIYFQAAKNNPGGYYRWFAYRCDAKGKDCVMLYEMSTNINSRIRIARQTGEIFTDERTGGELIFRRIENPTATVHKQ